MHVYPFVPYHRYDTEYRRLRGWSDLNLEVGSSRAGRPHARLDAGSCIRHQPSYFLKCGHIEHRWFLEEECHQCIIVHRLLCWQYGWTAILPCIRGAILSRKIHLCFALFLRVSMVN